ncbi:CHASE2 domain-containing protein [Kangiella sp. HD9-110m-PIT-SAG07]|nr:CHASE2 domain-containing protein [Kangiella sp. HD9-110m-PIT-SAG07]
MFEKRRFFTKGGILFATLLAITAFFLSYFKVFQPVELLAYDRMLRLQSTDYSENVVIVAMDEKSLREYGPLPWPRELHAKAIRQLTQANVRAIGYDVLFNKEKDEGDEALTQAVLESGRVVFPVVIDELKQDGQLIELQPFPELYQASAELGMVHFELDSDNIARAVYLKSGLGEPYWRTFAAEVLDVANGDETFQLPFEDAREEKPSFNLTKIEQTHYGFIPYKKNRDYFSKISFTDLVEGKIEPSLLNGRVVFVGVTATAARNADFLPVPVNRDGQIMSGVEINATLYEGLINNQLIRPVDNLLASVISGLLVLMLFMLIPRSMPRHNVYLVFVLAFVLLFVSWTLLHGANRWLPMLTPAIVMVAGYFLWVWRAVVTNMAFFRRTVKRLQTEVSNSFEPDVKATFEQHFQFWKRLNLIRGWSKDERDIVEYERSIPVDINNKPWLVELENHTEAERRLFYKLYEQSTLTAEVEETQGSVIEDKVAQVQTAITKINFLRRFVEKTMDKMSDGIVLLDMSGVIFYANLEAKKYLDVTEGQDIFEVLSQLNLQSKADWAEEIKSVMLTGVGSEVQALSKQKNYYKIGFTLLDNIEGQDFIIINLADITSVKREQQRQLEMIDFISHDLRSPMTSVLALLGQFRTKTSNLTVEELSAEVERLTQSSLSLAEHFLMLSRAESGIEMPLYPVELLNSIDNALAIARPLATDKNITIKFEFRDYEDTWLNANEDLLERVILNLLTNAIKYSPNDSVVEVSLKETDDGVCLLVDDQGEGIDAEQMETIFKPFSRIRRHEVSKIKGIGLGLRFVKAAMERFNGDVSVESDVGQGSCFILTFPHSAVVDDEMKGIS